MEWVALSLDISQWHICGLPPICYCRIGPGAFGPLTILVLLRVSRAGASARFRNNYIEFCTDQSALRDIEIDKTSIIPLITMQLQLISIVLILHCMEYTNCQQHGSRHRQHKRKFCALLIWCFAHTCTVTCRLLAVCVNRLSSGHDVLKLFLVLRDLKSKIIVYKKIY